MLNIVMKKLWKVIDFFDVKFITILMVVLFIIFGQIKQLLLLFLIAFIHELCHFFACYILKVEAHKIEILPFGVTLQIADSEKISSVKQIIVYLAGPLSILINYIWISFFYEFELINEINYSFLKRINIVTCIGNLMPIYPLDGYMVLKGFLQLLYPYKKALKTSIIVSLLFLVAFIGYNFISFQPLVTLFLIVEQIKHFVFSHIFHLLVLFGISCPDMQGKRPFLTVRNYYRRFPENSQSIFTLFCKK